MVKYIFGILCVLFLQFAHAVQPVPFPVTACMDSTPYGLPIAKAQIFRGLFVLPSDYQYVCRTAYLSLHDNKAKIPLLVTYVLTPEHTLGCLNGSRYWSSDKSLLSTGRSEPTDYALSGYDIGHFANDADFSWNEEVRKETFILSNASAQHMNLNRGMWKKLESYTRSWAFNRGHELVVYSGPIYKNSVKTIGNSVVVPTAYFKVIVDLQTTEVMSFMFNNVEQTSTNLNDYIVPLYKVEDSIDVILPLPEVFKESTSTWVTDIAWTAAAKKAACLQ